MPASTKPAAAAEAHQALAGMSPVDTARYTKELLDSLKGMALRQDHLVLAGLLDAAAREAKRLIANSF